MQPKSKDISFRSVYILFTVALILGIFSVLPEKWFSSLNVKAPDLFSDVRVTKQKKTYIRKKTKFSHKKVVLTKKQPLISPPPSGLIQIEYVTDTGIYPMYYFNKAVDSLVHSARPLHIAFFGDSYIEGDMMVGEFRDTLQKIWGGAGIGFLPPVTEVAGFRNTIVHTFSNDWKKVSCIDSPKTKTTLGINGHVYIPAEGSFVKLKPVNNKRLNHFNRLRIVYAGSNNDYIRISKSKSEPEIINLPPKSGQLSDFSININTSKEIKIEFSQTGNFHIFGLFIENDTGIQVDNYWLRGNSGIGLGSVKSAIYKRFGEIKNYDLIILQYGLNVANSSYTNYNWYIKPMKRILNILKASFPKTSFLIVGVGDRAEKDEAGEMTTMDGIIQLAEAQQILADSSGMAFYNLFNAMGGENSMVDFVKKGWANKDYTHLTFYGGKILAGRLARALIYESLSHSEF